VYYKKQDLLNPLRAPGLTLRVGGLVCGVCIANLFFVMYLLRSVACVCIANLFFVMYLLRSVACVSRLSIMQSVPITTKVVNCNPTHVLDTTLCDKICQ
jgi:hypothetical protein